MFNHQNLQMFYAKVKNISNFHPLEVVGRGSETQLQVGENIFFYCSALWVKVWCMDDPLGSIVMALPPFTAHCDHTHGFIVICYLYANS